ncbi:MAG: hypothetical protein IJG36_06665, partial [Synergistaceae bacterium]|nr:hypothetical protein [Synergistaceae bacterium]
KPEEPGLSAPFYMGTYGDMNALGPGMAVAFIRKKLAARSAQEVEAAGENPRIVEEKRKVYLPPAMREAFNQEEA